MFNLGISKIQAFYLEEENPRQKIKSKATQENMFVKYHEITLDQTNILDVPAQHCWTQEDLCQFIPAKTWLNGFMIWEMLDISVY